MYICNYVLVLLCLYMLRERERKINKKLKKWFYALAGGEGGGCRECVLSLRA